MKRTNKGRRFQPETLTPEEVRRLLASFSQRPEGIRNRALIAVLYRTGLRINDALTLYPKDLDLERGAMRVLNGKSGKSRMVGVDPGAIAMLKSWLDSRTVLGLNGTHSVFCMRHGQPIRTAYIRVMLPRFARRAGIEKRVHAHGLRHTHAAELREEGMDIGLISKQLGHSSIGQLHATSITLRRGRWWRRWRCGDGNAILPTQTLLERTAEEVVHMKAFVMHEIGRVGIIDKPIPRAGPNDAIIRTTAALICTSDTHTVGGAIGPRTDLTLGHEAVGVIHELGEAVVAAGIFNIGQRVAVNAITPCYSCENCQRGYTSQCGGMLGGWKFANVKDGSMAEYFHVNNAVANVAPIPDGLTDEQAAYCCDMLSTGFVAAEFGNIPIGGSVAVFGVGPVGMMAIVGARLCGAGFVIGVESMPHRSAMARKFGADEIVDYTKEDPVEAIKKLTGGKGVDTAIEALGSPQTFAACIGAARPGGTISNVGYHGDGDSVPIPREDWGVGMSDKTIRTALCPGGSDRMHRLMRLIHTGRVDPLAMTTHRFKFADTEKAFRMMQTKEDGMIKPLIMF